MEIELKIAHITDMHIGESDAPRGKLYPRQSFQKVLASVQLAKPDLIVLGGDLAADKGELKAYRWIKEALDDLKIPYHIMAGNHDVVENLESVFEMKGGPIEGTLYRKYQILDRTLIFLDSSTNTIDGLQLAQLKEDAGKKSGDIMLFIHHPPLFCGCHFMDHTYPLLNHDTVFPVIQSLPKIKYIICGHYHTEKTIVKDDKLILLTPSTMLQFSQTDPDFKIDFDDDKQPVGWRMITWKNGTIETNVIFV